MDLQEVVSVDGQRSLRVKEIEAGSQPWKKRTTGAPSSPAERRLQPHPGPVGGGYQRRVPPNPTVR